MQVCFTKVESQIFNLLIRKTCVSIEIAFYLFHMEVNNPRKLTIFDLLRWDIAEDEDSV